MAVMDDWTPAAFDRALCDLADAELDALVAFIDAQQRILDDALADDRAMLDALQAASHATTPLHDLEALLRPKRGVGCVDCGARDFACPGAGQAA